MVESGRAEPVEEYFRERGLLPERALPVVEAAEG
jgi:hypothetical protein